MIKRLKRRFVVTCMAAVTLMLIVTLGIINWININSTIQQTTALMDRLTELHSGAVERPPMPRPEDGFIQPPVENSAQASVHFAARVDADGTLLFLDLDHSSSLGREAAMEILDKALGQETGRIQGYHFRATADDDGTVLYVFLETTMARYAALRVLALSMGAGSLVWILMLAVVLLLTRQVLAPVVAGMEKQKQFIQDAGHEIKTPLAIMQANLDAMELRTGPSKWSGNIRQQVARLDGLMQDLLTLARLEDVNQDPQPLALEALTEQALQMFGESLSLRGVTLTRDLEPVQISGDAAQINRLLSILLDNAAKYVNDGGTVDVKLTGGRGAVLRVVNSCVRLPEADPERLFDRFYRGDAARNQQGGYGIGLSAAHAIVQAHRGSITAEYLDGQRIAFTVRLP